MLPLITLKKLNGFTSRSSDGLQASSSSDPSLWMWIWCSPGVLASDGSRNSYSNLFDSDPPARIWDLRSKSIRFGFPSVVGDISDPKNLNRNLMHLHPTLRIQIKGIRIWCVPACCNLMFLQLQIHMHWISMRCSRLS